jgi:hypothetical protein
VVTVEDPPIQRDPDIGTCISKVGSLEHGRCGAGPKWAAPEPRPVLSSLKSSTVCAGYVHAGPDPLSDKGPDWRRPKLGSTTGPLCLTLVGRTAAHPRVVGFRTRAVGKEVVGSRNERKGKPALGMAVAQQPPAKTHNPAPQGSTGLEFSTVGMASPASAGTADRSWRRQ